MKLLVVPRLVETFGFPIMRSLTLLLTMLCSLRVSVIGVLTEENVRSGGLPMKATAYGAG
jgi:hypothetical protein